MKAQLIEENDAFASVAEDWDNLLARSGQNSIFLSHAWFSAWWKSFGQGLSLRVFLFTDEGGELVGAAPLALQDDCLRFLASREVTDYCDFLLSPGYEEACLLSLLETLSTGMPEVKRVECLDIPEASPTLSVLPGVASEFGFAAESVVEDVVPVVSLASSYASYLEGLGKKARHEIRRKLRKIKSRKDIRLRRIGEPQALQRALPVFIELHRREGPEKQAFWKAAGMEDFFLTATLSLAEEAKAFLDVLETGDRMIAGLLSFREPDVVFLYNVAFDREFSSLSPGIALFHHVIQQAISEGATSVDFLKGREKYKYDFGAKDSTIYRLILKRTE